MGCDIPSETLCEWQVACIPLHFAFTDDNMEHTDMDISDFYREMRAGRYARTSSANRETYENAFREELRQGRDVLYLGFSSGLSGSVHIAEMTAQDLQKEFPERRVAVLDTKCGSVGLGLLVKLAVDRRDQGADFATLCAYVSENASRMNHWFTVDDLLHLRRGGRLKPTAAIIGTILQIKPVLHMDNTGSLQAVSKVRGRKAAIRALCDKFSAAAELTKDTLYAISHGDCPDDALSLQSLIQKRTGRPAALLLPIGPVIGAHSGPDTLALYFLGAER